MSAELVRAERIVRELSDVLEELEQIGGVLGQLPYKDWEALRVNLRRALLCARNMVEALRKEDQKRPSQ